MLLANELDKRARVADNDERVALFGKRPFNIFYMLRFQQDLTLERLSVHTRVDRKALSRLEDGLYTNPLPSVVTHWVRRGLASEGELLESYADFQYAQRRRHLFFFGPHLGVDYVSREHPFRQLRARRPSLIEPYHVLPVGLLECSRAMCLPVDTIQWFEKKWRNQQSVPKTMKAAFNEMGYSLDMIGNFEAYYKLWRANQMQHNGVRVI